MSYLARAKKCDLISLGEELGIDIPPNAKVTSLVKLIEVSEDFDEEFVKCRLEIMQEEMAEVEAKRIEIEEKQKEREFELKLLEIATKTRNLNREDISEADSIRVKQNPRNIKPIFVGLGDISIYLALFEKQMPHLNVPKENWLMYSCGKNFETTCEIENF